MHDKVEGEQRLRRLTTIVVTGSSLHRVGICISEPSGNEEEDTIFFGKILMSRLKRYTFGLNRILGEEKLWAADKSE